MADYVAYGDASTRGNGRYAERSLRWVPDSYHQYIRPIDMDRHELTLRREPAIARRIWQGPSPTDVFLHGLHSVQINHYVDNTVIIGLDIKSCFRFLAPMVFGSNASASSWAPTSKRVKYGHFFGNP